MDILVFMDISLQLSIILWISIWISLDFYGYPCIDLLWILDPGLSRLQFTCTKIFTIITFVSKYGVPSKTNRNIFFLQTILFYMVVYVSDYTLC